MVTLHRVDSFAYGRVIAVLLTCVAWFSAFGVWSLLGVSQLIMRLTRGGWVDLGFTGPFYFLTFLTLVVFAATPGPRRLPLALWPLAGAAGGLACGFTAFFAGAPFEPHGMFRLRSAIETLGVAQNLLNALLGSVLLLTWLFGLLAMSILALLWHLTSDRADAARARLQDPDSSP